MPLVDELSEWDCVYCGTKNDHTNPVRCWECNKKKPKWATVKRILKKRARDELKKKAEVKQEIIAKVDNVVPKDTVDLTFDIDKLIIE